MKIADTATLLWEEIRRVTRREGRKKGREKTRKSKNYKENQIGEKRQKNEKKSSHTLSISYWEGLST